MGEIEMPTRTIRHFLIGSLVLSPIWASVGALAFNSNEATGRAIHKFNTPFRKQEICVLANGMPNAVYAAADQQQEKQLCKYDFYGLTPGAERVAACPKINSTNPGINLLLTKKTLRYPPFAPDCSDKDPRLTMVAKHKQSISCSYTPSILMYYHLSRRFNGILNVPVAVLRTIDKAQHANWTDQALDFFPWYNRELIHLNWKHYDIVHDSPGRYPLLFTRDAQYLYGALLSNVKDEERYDEVHGLGGSYDNREGRFMQQKPFRKVADLRDVSELNRGLSISDKIQNIVQMQDVSNMVLFDYLLNQADRVGNIHYLTRYYSIEGENLRVEESPFPGSFKLKQMVLKDNDCGVVKENRFKAFSVLQKVRHMSPKTYQTFLTWTRELRLPELQRFLKREVLMTDRDINDPKNGLIANAMSARQILQANCRSGYLKLDLSLKNLDRMYAPDRLECEDVVR
jgi:hypothetical protein